jgi:endogenous inhibitor of DNA gyrase (YacG/DUF329 family)
MVESKKAPRCPVCRAEVAPRAQNPLFPFCSERCRQVDLGRWLQEEHRIPGEPALDLQDVSGRDDDQSG